MPVGFANRVPKHLGGCSIDKTGSLIEVNSIRSNDAVVSVLEAELLLLVDFISHVNGALVNKYDFCHFIQLIYKNGVFRFIPWLKFPKHGHHKVSVLGIVPGEKAVGVVIQESLLLVELLAI